jgi:hypothetical protein
LLPHLFVQGTSREHLFVQGTSREYIGPPSNALEAVVSLVCLFVGMGTSLIVVGAAVAAMDHLDEVKPSRAPVVVGCLLFQASVGDASRKRFCSSHRVGS